MSTFYLTLENIYELDQFFDVDNPDRLDEEIENIVSTLWINTGSEESLLKPFFSTFLQSNLLRPLYIYYFALKELQKIYPNIVIKASNSLLDIVASCLGVELSADRSMHDEDFYLIRRYQFSKAEHQQRGWKGRMRMLVWQWVRFKGWVTGVDVLYLNAGKLDGDLKHVKRKLSASWIPPRKSNRLSWNLDAISAQILENIQNMRLAVPTACLQKLVELRVLAYLPDLADRIGALVESIESLKVKLVIATAFTHEDHLCLLCAAKIAGIESLVLTHGVTFAKNIFLDGYANWQATLSPIDPIYEGATQFPMRYEWFERRI